MSLQRILLIDDNYQLIQGIQKSLKDDGYDIFIAANGMDGLKAARRHRPNLVILDINMPVMDGLEVCQRLREDNELRKLPILFLTSRNSVEDRVNGLDCGADDYLAKPFNSAELRARIRALLRRTQDNEAYVHANQAQRLITGRLTLDLKACWVKINDSEKIQLTPAEFELLQYLMSNPNQTFTGEELLERVWAYEPGTSDQSLARWHIRNLRAKIEPDPTNPIYIRTIPRHGYILNEETNRGITS
jgi:DNA-binding response OmpR family regulator